MKEEMTWRTYKLLGKEGSGNPAKHHHSSSLHRHSTTKLVMQRMKRNETKHVTGTKNVQEASQQESDMWWHQQGASDSTGRWSTGMHTRMWPRYIQSSALISTDTAIWLILPAPIESKYVISHTHNVAIYHWKEFVMMLPACEKYIQTKQTWLGLNTLDFTPWQGAQVLLS